MVYLVLKCIIKKHEVKHIEIGGRMHVFIPYGYLDSTNLSILLLKTISINILFIYHVRK